MSTLPECRGKHGFGNVYFDPSGKNGFDNVYVTVHLENMVWVMSILAHQGEGMW